MPVLIQLHPRKRVCFSVCTLNFQCPDVQLQILLHDHQAVGLYAHPTFVLAQGFRCNDHCQMVEPADGRGAVIIASEPLSKDEGWMSVQPNSLVVVQKDLQLDIRALEI